MDSSRLRAVARGFSVTSIGCLLAMLALVAGPVQTVRAATVIVDTTADSDDSSGCVTDGMSSPCSLRDAIAYANAHANTAISVPAGMYTLTAGMLTLSASMTITGAAANTTIVDANHASRALTVASGVTVSISGLTIANGSTGSVGNGANITNNGTLNLTDSVVTGGTTGANSGGGIFNPSVATALTIVRSTISGNEGFGAAIYNDSVHTVTVTNSTISGNDGDGGGILNAVHGTIQLLHTTLAGNTNGTGARALSAGTIRFTNSINTDGCANSGTVESGDYNIDSGISCGFGAQPHDQSNANPGLGAIQINGGTTPTMAPVAGSIAIDKIPNGGANCTATDQRSIARPQPSGGLCDIGAYEVTPSAASLAITGLPATAVAGASTSFTATAKDAGGNTAIAYTGTVHFTSSDSLATLPGDYTFTGGDNGAHGFSVTFRSTGSQSITATDTVSAGITGSASVTVTPPTNAVTVTTTTDATHSPGCADDGTTAPCSLRDAIMYANNHAGTTITVPAGTFILTGGGLTLTASTTLTGAGSASTIIAGGGSGSVLGLSGSLMTISGVTIRDGNASGHGGGMNISASASLTDIVVTSNHAAQAGGGIFIGPGASVTITNSTISSNTTDTDGGGIDNQGVVTIISSTINGNTATGNGGGLFQDGLDGSVTMTVTNSTVSGNTGGGAGGLDVTGNGTTTIIQSTFSNTSSTASELFTTGAVNVRNTILSGTCASSGGTIVSQDYNLSSDGSCGLNQLHDLPNTSAGIGALANNGGPTKTHALLAGSAAIDWIPNTGGCHGVGLTTDQRGVARPQPDGGLCDIGAFEASPSNAVSFTVSGFLSAPTAGVPGSVTVTAKDGSGNTVTSYVGTVQFTSRDTQATLPADYTFTLTDAGMHVFASGVTLKTAGPQNITVTDAATPTLTGTQSGITVNAASAASVTILGYPSAVTAGTTGSGSVTLRDAFNNIATGYIGTLRFTSSDPQATGGSGLPADYQFTSGSGKDNGIHIFMNGITLKTAGIQSITVTDTGNGSLTGTQSGITVNAATTSQFLVTGYPSPAQVNSSNAFMVIAKDAYSNTTSGYGGTVTFTSDDSQAILPANYPFTPADAGIHLFAATMKTPGTRSIIVTDTVTSTITGTQSNITVATGAANNATVAAGDIQNAVVGHAFSTALAVTITDAAGNPVSGAAVTFAAPGSGARGTFGTGATATVTTNASGVATAPTFTAGTTAGAYTVAVILPSGATFNLFTLTNMPDTANHFVLTGPSATTAGTAFSITVTAKDVNGNTVTGYRGTVHFTSTDAQATIGNGLPNDYVFTSGDSGAHTFISGVTLTTAGARTVTVADIVTATIAGSLPVQVSAASASILTASASSTPQTARIGTTFATPLTALVTDAFGNPVGGIVITFSAPGSGASGTFAGGALTATTNASGIATAPAFTANTAAGSYPVSASATGLTPVNFNLTNSPGNPGSITATAGGPQSATVGTTFGTAFAAIVRDGSSNPVPNMAVTFIAPVGGASGTFAGNVAIVTATTDAGGIATAPLFTANTTAGGYAVSASTTGVAAPATFNLTNDPGTATSLTIANLPNPTTAGASAGFTITARDQFGNVATGYGGTVRFTLSDTAGTPPGDYPFVASDHGVHVFAATFKTVGSQSLTATDTTNGTIAGTQSTQVNPSIAATIIVANYPSPIAINTAAGFTVMVRDSFGNTASGYTGALHFTSTDSQATLPANYTFTGADQGVHSFTATLKTPGTRSITATDTVTNTITGTQSNISVITTTPSAINVSAGSNQSVAVHTDFGAAMAVTVTDAASNPVPNVTVTFVAPASGASGTFAGNLHAVNVTTNASGAATAPIFTANTIPGGYNVTASVGGVATPATFALSNTPGPAASYTLGGLPNSVQAGTSLNITLTAKDAFGNTATGYRGVVTFALSDTAGTKPANYTFTAVDAGVHTFAGGLTLKTLGMQSLTATDTNTPTVTGSQPVQVIPGPAASVALTGFPSPVAAGTAASFTVVIRDAFGNTASGYTGTLHFTSTDGAAIVPADYIFTGTDQGVHAFLGTMKTPGTQSLTATDTVTNTLTNSQTGITVTPAATIHLAVTAPASASAGVPFSVTVTAKDSLNNTVTSYTRTVRFTSSDPQATLPGDYTFVATDSGTHTFTVTLRTAGGRTLTVTDMGEPTITGAAAVSVSGPTISGVSPLSGPPTGGTTITAAGTNLQGASVMVGDAACTSVQVNGTGTSLTCVTPAHATIATVDVVVTTSSGTATAHNAFTYVTPEGVGQPAPRTGSGSAGSTGGAPVPAPTGR